MHTFLRYIGRSLIESGRVRKYLLYAIGEITLLVIGILIALQLNHWNESRKERAEEILLLENLQTEYENIITQVEYLNTLREKLLQAIDNFHNIIKARDHSYTDHEIDSLLAITLLNPTFNGVTGTQEILFSAGKIDLVTNPEIKKKLIEWSAFIEDMTEDETRLLKTYHEAYFPLISEFAPMYEVMRAIKYRGLQFPTRGKSTVKRQYQKLLEDARFENLISQRYTLTLVGLEGADLVISKGKEILDLIRLELH